SGGKKRGEIGPDEAAVGTEIEPADLIAAELHPDAPVGRNRDASDDGEFVTGVATGLKMMPVAAVVVQDAAGAAERHGAIGQSGAAVVGAGAGQIRGPQDARMGASDFLAARLRRAFGERQPDESAHRSGAQPAGAAAKPATPIGPVDFGHAHGDASD